MKKESIFSYVLVLVSLFLWLSSAFEAREGIPEGLRFLGLFSVMPIGFIISLTILSMSFFITLNMKNEHQRILFCQFALLIVFINLTPVLVEGTPRFSSTYANYHSVDYVIKKGYINPSAQWIHNWPAFSILESIFVQVAAVPAELILSMYPTMYNFILFFPLFAFFRLMFNNTEQCWIAMWIFYIVNWIGQDYFSMQSLGFFAFVLFSLVLFKFGNNNTRARNWLILMSLLFFLVASNHLLSSVVVLSLILVFFAFKQFRKLSIVVLLIVIFGFWTMFGATIYLEWNAEALIKRAFDFWFKFQTSVVSRVAGSPGRVIASQTRLVFSALVLLLGFIGITVMHIKRENGKTEKKLFLMMLSICLLLFFSSYGGELFMRIFLFSLVPLCYFIVKGWSRKILYCLLLVFLIFLTPSLYMIARYGNESMDYVPPSELKGAEFFSRVTTYGYVIGQYREIEYRDNYRYTSFSSTEWKNDVLVIKDIEEKYVNWPRFVCLSYGVSETYNFFLGEPQFIISIKENLTQSIHYNGIYSNPNFIVYLKHT